MHRLIALFTVMMFLTGCHFYEVQDRQTGRVYYTDKWVAADGYRGPLTMTDEHGRKLRIADARVIRLSKEDYIEESAKARQAEDKNKRKDKELLPHENP